MLIARVVGTVWSTKKDPKINALRLLFVQPLGRDLQPVGNVLVAADEIGAGLGETVLVTQGSPAQGAVSKTEPPPIDAAVVGIVDSLDLPETG
ncbi:MAG: EutN/CcmL family microcompartment protein [Thermodesulfobacteriota bacterium]